MFQKKKVKKKVKKSVKMSTKLINKRQTHGLVRDGGVHRGLD